MIEGAYRNELVKLIVEQISAPSRGAEIGVHKGKASALLLRTFAGCELWMVDTWPDNEHCATAMTNTAFAPERRHPIQDDSVSAARRVPDELDFVFVDADHSRAGCLRDMMAYWPKIREGGLFCGHDYKKRDIPGVTQAVFEFGEMHEIEFNTAKGNIWWTIKSET